MADSMPAPRAPWKPSPQQQPPLDTPFGRFGRHLVDNGYSALPVRPGTKAPGTMFSGRWRMMGDWTRFCRRLPTPQELDTWGQYPDAGLCVACGFNGLIAVDIDVEDDAVVQAIMSVLPPATSRQARRQGPHAVLPRRHAADSESCRSTLTTGRALDLLSDGRQTVLPPTIHPSGVPYVWLSERTLLDTPPEDLPALPDRHRSAVGGGTCTLRLHRASSPARDRCACGRRYLE